VDLTEFHVTNLVRELICLVYALGYTEVHCIISHDFGTVPGSYAPLIRPDIFKSSIQVSIPFVAPGLPPLGIMASAKPPETLATAVHRFAILENQLEKLHPPRKHYQWYNSGPTAANHWVSGGTLGLRAFFRGYLYLKSHNGPGNRVNPPKEFTAIAHAVMPEYLLLPDSKTMPEVVGSMSQGHDPLVSEAWLSQKDLDVYVSEYQRSGFQRNLNWYRVVTSKLEMARDTLILAGAKLQVPTAFIIGEQDWSSYLIPGSIERYSESCTDFRGVTVIPNSGHWVPGEQPEALLEAFVEFLDSLKRTGRA
jgi:pimeloyl-ACP methyl ester carboxylesterase